MKNPAAFLTFTSLSLSLCLLAQYLCGSGTEVFFSEMCGHSCRIPAVVFNGFSQLSHLAFGIFLYNRSPENSGGNNAARFPTLYFSYFSLALSFVTTVLLFSHRAFIFSAFWAAILIFFIIVLLLALPRLNAGIYFLCFPQIIFAASLLGFSIFGIALRI